MLSSLITYSIGLQMQLRDLIIDMVKLFELTYLRVFLKYILLIIFVIVK